VIIKDSKIAHKKNKLVRARVNNMTKPFYSRSRARNKKLFHFRCGRAFLIYGSARFETDDPYPLNLNLASQKYDVRSLWPKYFM